jgi:hypothetical protein
MSSRMSITYIDYSGEKSTISFNCVALSPGNVAAQETLLIALAAAIAPCVLGNKVKTEIVYAATTPDNTPASDEGAQRELKWLVRYTDNVNGKVGRLEIPTAEGATHLVSNSDLALDTGEMGALRTAIEAVVRSVDGNAITVLDIHIVGRNL